MKENKMNQFEVKVEKLVAGGTGLSKIENKVCFTPYVLPGEKIKITPSKTQKKVIFADLVSVEETSDQRIEPSCQYFTECGGCHFQHANYEEQLRLKKSIFQEQLERIGSLNFDSVPEVNASPKKNSYRSKIEFRLFTVKKELFCGLASSSDSKRSVPIDYCHLVTDQLNKIQQSFKTAFNQLCSNSVVKRFERLTIIEYSAQDYFIHLQGFSLKLDQLKEAINQVKKEFPNLEMEWKITSLEQEESAGGKKKIKASRNKKAPGTFHISPKNLHRIDLGKTQYFTPSGAFIQINQPQFSQILDQMESWVKVAEHKDSLLELYSGSGVISFYLAEYFKEQLGIDFESEAIKSANRLANKEEFSHLKFKSANLSKPIREEIKEEIKSGFWIIDPPRSGLTEVVRDLILEKLPKEIIYLSCDGGTFSRDLGILSEKYEVEDLTLWDMFPQTYHLEVLAKLKLKV